MPCIVQRVPFNSDGWTKPSSERLGKDNFGSYVKKHGFGPEDWILNRDLVIRGHVYGHAARSPLALELGERFNIAFVAYCEEAWGLAGVYVDAEFAPNGAPPSKAVLRAKMQDVIRLKTEGGLGGSWARLSESEIIDKLGKQCSRLRWRVAVENVVQSPKPVLIPPRILELDIDDLRVGSWISTGSHIIDALKDGIRHLESAPYWEKIYYPYDEKVRTLARSIPRPAASVMAEARARFLHFEHERARIQLRDDQVLPRELEAKRRDATAEVVEALYRSLADWVIKEHGSAALVRYAEAIAEAVIDLLPALPVPVVPWGTGLIIRQKYPDYTPPESDRRPLTSMLLDGLREGAPQARRDLRDWMVSELIALHTARGEATAEKEVAVSKRSRTDRNFAKDLEACLDATGTRYVDFAAAAGVSAKTVSNFITTGKASKSVYGSLKRVYSELCRKS